MNWTDEPISYDVAKQVELLREQKKWSITMTDGDMVECTNEDFPNPIVLTDSKGDTITVNTEMFYILTPKNLAIQRNPLRRIIGFTRRNLWKL